MSIVAITGEISYSHVAAVRAATEAAPQDPLTIILDSLGGQTGACLALADAISLHPGPTIGRAVRRCDSGAVLALAVCERRAARLGTRFKLHATAPLRPPEGRLTAARMRQLAGELDTLDSRFRHRIAAAIGCDVEQLARLEAGDTTLDTLRALELGFLTEIVGCSTLGPAAARRREAQAEARAAAARPIRWTLRDFQALRAMGLKPGRPIGVGRHMLKAMLAERS